MSHHVAVCSRCFPGTSGEWRQIHATRMRHEIGSPLSRNDTPPFPPPWSVDHSPTTRRRCSSRISSVMLDARAAPARQNGAFRRHDRQYSARNETAYRQIALIVRLRCCRTEYGGRVSRSGRGGSQVQILPLRPTLSKNRRLRRRQ